MDKPRTLLRVLKEELSIVTQLLRRANLINGFVYIIESPSAQDLLDGRTEGRALSESMQLAKIPHRYNLAVNCETLVDALRGRLLSAIGDFGNALPILHFSAHGNQQGIELTSGEFLRWHQLEELLQPLHNLYSHGLLICISSCESYMGIQMAMVDEHQRPFWALVSHMGKPTWADACVGYIAFYNRFFKGHRPEDCVEAMKHATGDTGFVFEHGEKIKADWLARAAENMRAAEHQGILSSLFANPPDIGSNSENLGPA